MDPAALHRIHQILFGNRWYSNTVGRWTQRDTTGRAEGGRECLQRPAHHHSLLLVDPRWFGCDGYDVLERVVRDRRLEGWTRSRRVGHRLARLQRPEDHLQHSDNADKPEHRLTSDRGWC